MAPVDSVTQLVETLNKENAVMIWSKSYCPFCNKVKDIFKSINQPYKSYELDLEGKFYCIFIETLSLVI